MAKKVLGKGLEALIPKKAAAAVAEEDEEFAYIDINQIARSKFQPRKTISPQELEELSASIKEKGIIQPIVVRRRGEGYEVVAGGRRFEAAKSLGVKKIPTIVKDLSDEETFIFAIVENLQRKNLNPLEEAEAIKRLIDEFSFTLEEVGKFLGKDKSFIANALRLLRLPPDIKEALARGTITYTQARTILALKDEASQRRLFQELISQKLTVRELETKVRLTKKKRPQDPFILEMEEKLQRTLGTKVKVLNKKNNRGKIVIEYYSLDDLERILKRFT